MTKLMMQFLTAVAVLTSWVLILAGGANAATFALVAVTAILFCRLTF